MATPPISDNPQVEEHYLAQFAIVAAASAAARNVFPSLDPTNIEATFPTVTRGLIAIADQFARASISVAADHYDQLRSETVPGPFNTLTITATLDGFTAALSQTAKDGASAVAEVADELFLAEIAFDMLRQGDAAVRNVVADSASDQIFAAMSQDREARGWARITRPGACYFCRMLASRGAVYLTQRSGSFRAHVPKDGRGGTCRCTVEPLFAREYEPTAQARADAETWKRVTPGLKGPDAIDAFRRELEGRTDGPRRRRRRGDAKRNRDNAPVKPRFGFDDMDVPQLENQLRILESLPDSEYRTKQLVRVRNRLAELGT